MSFGPSSSKWNTVSGSEWLSAGDDAAVTDPWEGRRHSCWLIRDRPSEQSRPCCHPARRRPAAAAAAAAGASSGTRWWSPGVVVVAKTAASTAALQAAWRWNWKRWLQSPSSSWWRRSAKTPSKNGHRRHCDVQRHRDIHVSTSSSSLSSSLSLF